MLSKITKRDLIWSFFCFIYLIFPVKPKTPTLVSSVPQDVKIIEHTAFTLTCQTASTSTADIKYMFVIGPNKLHWTTTSTYSIYDASIIDTGSYSCIVKIKSAVSESSLAYPISVHGGTFSLDCFLLIIMDNLHVYVNSKTVFSVLDNPSLSV